MKTRCKRRQWRAKELDHASLAAIRVLCGESFYSETKKLKEGPLKRRSFQSIRNKLIRLRNTMRNDRSRM
jgi:hypothetical protein